MIASPLSGLIRTVQLIAGSRVSADWDVMLADTQPGRLRLAWLDFWLRKDLSGRLAGIHWVRLLSFSLLLHDTPKDVARALVGRYRAYRRQAADLAAFSSSGIE